MSTATWELLLERRIEVDHVTVYRWVQRFPPLLADAALFCRRMKRRDAQPLAGSLNVRWAR